MIAIEQAVSAALLHFVWQGLVVAFVVWIVLFALRNRSANARYLASCAGLLCLTVLPVITACVCIRGWFRRAPTQFLPGFRGRLALAWTARFLR